MGRLGLADLVDRTARDPRISQRNQAVMLCFESTALLRRPCSKST
jgi:hypothetical protein